MTVDNNENRVSAMSLFSGFVQILAFIPKVLIPVFLIVTTVFWGRAMGLAIYNKYFLLPEEMKVARVVGKDVQVAEGVLDKLGLGIDVQETRYSDKVKKGVVMEQYPPPGQNTREGSKVSVVVSMGPYSVVVPKVTGMGFRDAQVALHNAKLEVGRVTRVAKNKNDPEIVLEQNPRPDKAVKKGTRVNLMVNIGNVARVKVPSFANQPLDRVRDSASWNNLKLGRISWLVHESIGPGMVINQDPAPDKEVPPGTEVNIRVSVGPPAGLEVRQRLVQVRTPDVTGLQQIRVMVTDANGSHSAYEGTHAQGEIVNVYVTSMGGIGEYEVFANDKQISHGHI